MDPSGLSMRFSSMSLTAIMMRYDFMLLPCMCSDASMSL